MNDSLNPVLFVSHGAPDLPLTEHPAKHAWQEIGKKLPRPQGIIVISAHWLTNQVTISTADSYTTIHDFSGFPSQLYQIEYPAQGSKSLAAAIQAQLARQGLYADTDSKRGLDHGAWVPLSLLYPQADIPVVAVSLPMSADLDGLFALGRGLAELRRDNLILCSGAVTHNLRELAAEGTPPADWAISFSAWVKQQLTSAAWVNLKQFHLAPYARMAHPTDEHFLPLFVAAGAAQGQKAQVLHDSFSYGNLAMTVFAFADKSQQLPVV